MTGPLAQIVALIGLDAAERLCREYGGISHYIPKRPTPRHGFARVLTTDEWAALCREFGGGALRLPQGQALKRRRALELIAQGSLSVREIALAVGGTERWVSRLRAQHARQKHPSLPFGASP